MVFFVLILMSALAWRLGAFDEWARHRQLQVFEQDLLPEMDEADWEDRQIRFRRTHPRLGHRRPHMSLGRKR